MCGQNLALAIEPLTHAQLLTPSERWSASVSSPRGMMLLDVTQDSDVEAALSELERTLREDWGIDGALAWAETSPGVWTAEL